MTRQFELGVFLPIGRNGFFISERTPQYNPTFELNREISQIAEEAGLDYVFSMCKWRGFGGSTGFWDETLESLMLMSGLAVATERVKVIATVNPLAVHPAVAAKMIATLDEVSGGRCGINLITGASPGEYKQMGLWPEGYNMGRYHYADEWVNVVKSLWTQERVDFDGDFFKLEDCVSDPKPLQKPHPFLVCAGTSDEGFSFTARHCDYSFLGGGGIEDTKQLSLRMKSTARSMGREVKTATTLSIIQGDTDAAADELFDYYFEGADDAALDNIARLFGGQDRERQLKRERAKYIRESICFAGRPVIGGPETISRTLTDLHEQGEVDSILLIFPDYVQGLKAFQKSVLPLLEEERLGQETKAAV
jgi:pyrimidine oxygenase